MDQIDILQADKIEWSGNNASLAFLCMFDVVLGWLMMLFATWLKENDAQFDRVMWLFIGV